jgi:hypothetical protein
LRKPVSGSEVGLDNPLTTELARDTPLKGAENLRGVGPGEAPGGREVTRDSGGESIQGGMNLLRSR